MLANELILSHARGEGCGVENNTKTTKTMQDNSQIRNTSWLETGQWKWFAFSLCLLRRLPQRRRRHVKFGEIQSTEHSKNLGFNSVGSGQVKKMVPRKTEASFHPHLYGAGLCSPTPTAPRTAERGLPA